VLHGTIATPNCANGVRNTLQAAHRRRSCVAHFLSASGRAGCSVPCLLFGILDGMGTFSLCRFVSKLLGNAATSPEYLCCSQGSQVGRIHGTIHVNYEEKVSRLSYACEYGLARVCRPSHPFCNPRFNSTWASEICAAIPMSGPPLVHRLSLLLGNLHFRSHLAGQYARLSQHELRIQKKKKRLSHGRLSVGRWLERVVVGLNPALQAATRTFYLAS